MTSEWFLKPQPGQVVLRHEKVMRHSKHNLPLSGERKFNRRVDLILHVIKTVQFPRLPVLLNKVNDYDVDKQYNG